MSACLEPGLFLPAAQRARLEDWSRARYPREACGLLLGRRSGCRIEVVEAVETPNTAGARAHERFALDPLTHLALEEAASARELEVVGVWHSHPDRSARPSEADRRTACAGWSYVIVAVSRGGVHGVRSWRLAGPRFEEEALNP